MNYFDGDVGTEVKIKVDRNPYSASVLEFRVLKPSGVVAVWLPTVVDTTHIHYFTVAGDLEVGTYKLQVYAEIGVWKGLSSTVTFAIGAPFS